MIQWFLFQDDIKNGDEIENMDSLESEELLSVACVIEKLSENVTNKSEDEEENGGSVRDITSKAIRQTIEENEDLKRQNILLEQKLEEKERKIKALERILVTEEKSYGMLSNKKTSYINSASQVGDLAHCKKTVYIYSLKVGQKMIAMMQLISHYHLCI